MTWPRRWTLERLAEFRALAATGRTAGAIATAMGESYDAIVTARKQYCVPIARANRKWDEATVADVARKISAGLTVRETAQAVGAKPGTLQSILGYKSPSELAGLTYGQRMKLIVAKRRRFDRLPTPALIVRKISSPLHSIRLLLPQGLPSFLRDDVEQDIMLALLEGGELTKDLVRAKLAGVRRMFSRRDLSLDAPVPGGGGRLLHEYVSESAR